MLLLLFSYLQLSLEESESKMILLSVMMVDIIPYYLELVGINSFVELCIRSQQELFYMAIASERTSVAKVVTVFHFVIALDIFVIA